MWVIVASYHDESVPPDVIGTFDSAEEASEFKKNSIAHQIYENLEIEDLSSPSKFQ